MPKNILKRSTRKKDIQGGGVGKKRGKIAGKEGKLTTIEPD